jgi:hypothetical protein
MHPFEKLQKAAQRSDAQRGRDREDVINFEVLAVETLLSCLHLGKYRNELIEAQSRCSDQAYLTLTAFNTRFPEFPILMGANPCDDRPLHLCKEAFMPALFRKFERAPFVKAYDTFCDAQERHAQGRALGLIFRRKGSTRGGWIIHQGGLEVFRTHGSAFMCHQGGSIGQPVDTYVRNFKALIVAIAASGWRPS